MPMGNYVEHKYGTTEVDPPGWTPGVHHILHHPICPECLGELRFRGEGLDPGMDLYYDQYECEVCGADSYEYH